MNRLEESLNLFEQIVNNIFFRDASFVLLLNKFDLFREKILYSNRHLRLYFPDYKGETFHIVYVNKNSFVRSKYSSSTHLPSYLSFTFGIKNRSSYLFSKTSSSISNDILTISSLPLVVKTEGF